MKKDRLDIIYEDKYIIIVNKPYHLLTIGNDKEKENTLYHKISLYLKRKNKNNKVFIVHRLDYDTSGVIIFAKDSKIKTILQDNWNKVIRKYMAIVNGKMEKDEETLKSYLKETKTNLVYSTNSKLGKLAITKYKTVLRTDKYSLLDISIETGRKNQIRVQLSDINHSIVGDKKYDTKDNSKRMYLCAYYLKFNHPVTKKELEFELDVPKDFLEIINKK